MERREISGKTERQLATLCARSRSSSTGQAKISRGGPHNAVPVGRGVSNISTNYSTCKRSSSQRSGVHISRGCDEYDTSDRTRDGTCRCAKCLGEDRVRCPLRQQDEKGGLPIAKYSRRERRRCEMSDPHSRRALSALPGQIGIDRGSFAEESRCSRDHAGR